MFTVAFFLSKCSYSHSNKFQDDMEKLERLLDIAVKQYQDGFPLHLSDPTRSAIAIMTATDFGHKTAGEIQELLRKKHLLISDCEKDTTFKFDKAGLDTLCLSVHPIEVQGRSSVTIDNSSLNCLFSYLCRPVCPCMRGWRGRVMANNCYHLPTPGSSACTRWKNFECFGVPNGVSVFGSTTQVFNRPSCSSRCRTRHCSTHFGHPLGYGGHWWCMYLVPC
jgi:hypothetical protein